MTTSPTFASPNATWADLEVFRPGRFRGTLSKLVLASGVLPVADAVPGPDRLQLVAVLLGILVFGVIVLLVERRNSTNEAAPPGMTSSVPPRPAPRRQVYRPPVTDVPTASARDAAAFPSPDAPYPVPFLDPAPAKPEDVDSNLGAG